MKKKIILKMRDSETIAEEAKINRSLAKTLLLRFPIDDLSEFAEIIKETPDERTENQLAYLRSSVLVYQRMKKQYLEQMKAELKSNQEPPKIMQMTTKDINDRKYGIGVDVIAKTDPVVEAKCHYGSCGVANAICMCTLAEEPTCYGPKDLMIRVGMIVAISNSSTTIIKVTLDELGDKVVAIELGQSYVPEKTHIGMKVCVVCNLYDLNGVQIPKLLRATNNQTSSYVFSDPVGAVVGFSEEKSAYPSIHVSNYPSILANMRVIRNNVVNSRGEHLHGKSGFNCIAHVPTGTLF